MVCVLYSFDLLMLGLLFDSVWVCVCLVFCCWTVGWVFCFGCIVFCLFCNYWLVRCALMYSLFDYVLNLFGLLMVVGCLRWVGWYYLLFGGFIILDLCFCLFGINYLLFSLCCLGFCDC